MKYSKKYKKYFLDQVKHRLSKNQSKKWSDHHKVYAVNFFEHIFYYQSTGGFKRNEFLNCIAADLRNCSHTKDFAEYFFETCDAKTPDKLPAAIDPSSYTHTKDRAENLRSVIDPKFPDEIRTAIENYYSMKDGYYYLEEKLGRHALFALMDIDFRDN